ARARFNRAKAVLLYSTGRVPEARELQEEGLRLARAAGDLHAQINMVAIMLNPAGPFKLAARRLQLAEEYAGQPRDEIPIITLSTFLVTSAWTFLNFGKRELADGSWHEIEALAERTGHAFLAQVAAPEKCRQATLDGRLEDGLVAGSLSRDSAGSAVGTLARDLAHASCQAAIWLGRAAELTPPQDSSTPSLAVRPYLLLAVGRVTDAA